MSVYRNHSLDCPVFNAKFAIALINLMLLAALLSGCHQAGVNSWSPTLSSQPRHLTLGNPSNATSERSNGENYLMVKPQYVLSYNRRHGIPNWVSWSLDASWLGEVERQDDFRPDDTLPQGWDQVTPRDYTRSGYDRGHMAPSGDRTNTVANNSATFLMTNIVPQAPNLNRGPWVDLENDCRAWVDQGKVLYIMAGGYGEQAAIADGKVVPPRQLWKVVVVLDPPAQTAAAVTTQTRVIAVDMPNQAIERSTDWSEFTVSVDQLEAATGYDFLSEVPDSVQEVIERTVASGG